MNTDTSNLSSLASALLVESVRVKLWGFFFSWKLCMICLYDFWQIPVNSLQSVSNSGPRFKKCFYFIIENLLSMGFDIMVKDFKEKFITVNYYLVWMCWIHTFFVVRVFFLWEQSCCMRSVIASLCFAMIILCYVSFWRVFCIVPRKFEIFIEYCFMLCNG